MNNLVVDSCTPGIPTGADDDCNGIDENCNDTADENYAATPTTCGVGVCASTGQTTCQGGVRGDSCTSGTPGVESFADGNACSDTLDNDCDGLTDLADPGCINNPQIAVTPDNTNFGIIKVGSTEGWQFFTITNTGGLNLFVSSIEMVTADNTDFMVVPDTCADLPPTLTGRTSCSVSAAFTPSATLARSTLLRITSNASNIPIVDIHLAGTCSLDPMFSDALEGTLYEKFINTIY